MPDRIADHYIRNAHAFDEARRKNFVERGWLDRMLLAVPRGGDILDLGCGGGEPIARYLIDRGHHVTGVDASDEMIALVRARFGRHQWHHLDMRQLATERRFHAVVAWDSLFHLPHADQAMMIARIATWLEPGGAFLFNTGAARGPVLGCQFGEEIFHDSFTPGEYRSLLAQVNLLEVGFVPDDRATGGRSVWLVRKGH